jgi:transposase InsO family protein
VDLGRFLIETHLRTARPIKELAAAHDVSARWLFKLLARYRLEGAAGLEPRSRRPHRCPTRIADVWEDEIVGLHKRLADDGLDAGAATIHYHLSQSHRRPPSVSTVFRVLKARGFVALQPQKRPKRSLTRFVADLPNECWQADMTHFTLANGESVEILNIIDDHSRVCIASRAMKVVKAPDVVRVLHKAAETWGYPASLLTDNGLIFTGQLHFGFAGVVEQELFALGINAKHSRPYHPQTCGKVERFHETLKKFLRAQKGIETRKQLQRAIDRFVAYYNDVRPHRSIGRHTPRSVFAAREMAQPTPPMMRLDGRRLRFDKVDGGGSVTIRHRGKLHHIGIGRPYAGWRVVMFVDGLSIEIVALDGSPLRKLVLDPAVDYQRAP